MPSFSDSIVLFVLALLLFGPKKLPVLARELGKWVGEFRRASNEFKMQMEDELRASEQADRRKQIDAMEAAAPVAPVLDEPEHPHMPSHFHSDTGEVTDIAPLETETVTPLPIATSGDLSIMPPSTGLPVAQSRSVETAASDAPASPLGGLLDSIPSVADNGASHGIDSTTGVATETATHG